MNDGWAHFDDLLDWGQANGADVGLRIEGGSEVGWSCELRVTPNPNRAALLDLTLVPDLSLVFFAVGGGASPEGVLAECIAEFDRRRELIAAVEKEHHGLPRWDEDQ